MALLTKTAYATTNKNAHALFTSREDAELARATDPKLRYARITEVRVSRLPVFRPEFGVVTQTQTQRASVKPRVSRKSGSMTASPATVESAPTEATASTAST